MKQIVLPISIASAYLLVYIYFVITKDVSWASLLFGLSPIPVIWMVVRILKDGTYPEHLEESFGKDDKFYETY